MVTIPATPCRDPNVLTSAFPPAFYPQWFPESKHGATKLLYGGLAEPVPEVWGFVSSVEGFLLCCAGSAKGCVDPPHQGKDGLWGRQAFSSF